MKYIRTKDDILLFGGTHDKGKVIVGKKDINNFGFCFDKKDIVNRADTIKELCDRFVVYVEDLDTYLIFDYYDEACSYVDALEYECKLFGVIEIDKGLIYVAKMNDKGELELI